MNGLLVVDKPAGMTSHDVVGRCRRILGERKIGHAGTLDPDATGVLVLGVGRATRLLQFLEATEKRYRTTFALGVTTTTQDAAGDIVETKDASAVTADDVQAVLPKLVGEIEQVPPMVSAIKIGGEPLYKKARRGEDVERPARRVTVHELRLETMTPPTLLVRCSKGTYVRTLVHDLGQMLAVGAHVVTLRRTAVGAFDEMQAVPLDALKPADVRPIEDAVAGYPRRDLTSEEATRIVHGKRIAAAGIDGPYAAFNAGTLLGMLEDRADEARSLCVIAPETAR